MKILNQHDAKRGPDFSLPNLLSKDGYLNHPARPASYLPAKLHTTLIHGGVKNFILKIILTSLALWDP